MSARFWRNRHELVDDVLITPKKDTPFCLQFSERKVIDGSFWNCWSKPRAQQIDTIVLITYQGKKSWIVRRENRENWHDFL